MKSLADKLLEGSEPAGFTIDLIDTREGESVRRFKNVRAATENEAVQKVVTKMCKDGQYAPHKTEWVTGVVFLKSLLPAPADTDVRTWFGVPLTDEERQEAMRLLATEYKGDTEFRGLYAVECPDAVGEEEWDEDED